MWGDTRRRRKSRRTKTRRTSRTSRTRRRTRTRVTNLSLRGLHVYYFAINQKRGVPFACRGRVA